MRLTTLLKLKATRSHWEKLARRDARWAILTDQEKSGNKWQADDFYATGRIDVAKSLDWIRDQNIKLPQGEALDFGCGVGRLTQALAGHFHRVTGVDVSAEMISQARASAKTDVINYVHNPEPDLRRFATGRFALVYSLITLQHIPPELSCGYIAEFCRISAPGGLILFQMTASRPAPRTFSYYPPTLLRRILESIAIMPRMDVYAIRRAEVEAILHTSGANILAVRPHENGAIESYLYLAQKR